MDCPAFICRILDRFHSDDDVVSFFEITPKKRYMFQTATSDYWCDNYVVHKDASGVFGYLSIINVTEDGRHIITDIYSQIEAMHDFEPEHTLESFQQMIDDHMERADAAKEQFAEEIAKRVKTTKSEKIVGYQ